MNNKNCSGTMFLRSFSWLIFLLAGFIPPAYAKHQFLSWEEFPQMSFQFPMTFSPGPIKIPWGSIEYLSNELTPGVCRAGDKPGDTFYNDTINAVAHVYVVLRGKVYPNSSTRIDLRPLDVTGAVNTIIQDSGIFMDQFIGEPTTGSVFSIVYDECQDGYFDDNVDFLLYSAFRWGSGVLQLSPAEVDEIKLHARYQAFHYRLVAASTGILLAISDILPTSDDFLIFLSYTTGPNKAYLRVGSFAEVIRLQLNYINRALAIAADPPDAGFMQLTPLSGRQIIDLQSSDPLLIAFANLGTATSTQGALAEALLHSLERYQGAEAAGDGDWALTHARAIKQYAGLLAAQLPQMNDALGQLSNALASDTRPLDMIAADLESQRARVELSGFSGEERQALASLGLTVAQIDALQTELASQSFVFTKADLLNAITNAQNGNAAYSTALSNLAAAMDANITALEQDPVVTNLAPRAHAGGPYHGAEGVNIVFNGSASSSPSNIISYAWDLDGDGSFNDAIGPNPSFTYTRAFQGLVGLKVTNADNLEDVSYAPLEVTNVNNPPRITAFQPTDRFLDLIPGSSQGFSVTASDPEGDAVSVRWLVDGTPTATGASFTYTPSTASGGLHLIEAVATDASPLGGSDRLTWIVALPAPADSVNLSITMNGTSEAGQGSDQLTYEITVTNNGPAAATGVMLTDTLPAGLAFGSMTASQGSCTAVDPRTVTCGLGDLASGASATAALIGTPTTTATITNTARVTAAEFDPDLANNSASQGIVVDFVWLRQSGVPVKDDYATVAADTSGVYVTTWDASGASLSQFLIKYDTSGTEVWRREFTDRAGWGVAADASGVYTIGLTFVGGHYDPTISKFDAHGAELWTREFGGSSTQNPYDIAVATGGVYVAVNGGVRKYDTNGTELWTQPLNGPISVAADASGVYVLASLEISKYDVDGNGVWTIPVADFSSGIRANSVLAVDASGVYLVSSGARTGDFSFVRKYTKDGNELWTRQFVLYFNPSLAVASDGSTVYVGGLNPLSSPNHAPGVIRTYDVDGNELSTQVFGDANNLFTGVEDVAVGCAGVFAAGYTVSNISFESDTFVMKLSSPAHPCYLDAPTVSATSPMVVVNEGQVGRNSGIYANPGTHQPVSLSASVGTLTKMGSQEGSWEWSFNTTDGPAQSQLVTITAEDGEGGMSTALFELIVNNVAPIETISGAPTSSPAGTPITLTSKVTDGGGADSQAGFTYAWTVTRDDQLVASGSGSNFSFTPTVGGDYQVTLRVTDKDGGTSVNTVTIGVVQTNRPPLANAGPDRTVEATSPAGAAAVLDGSASSDPDGDVLTFTWTGVFGTATGQAPTVALPFGAHTIMLMVDDG